MYTSHEPIISVACTLRRDAYEVLRRSNINLCVVVSLLGML